MLHYININSREYRIPYIFVKEREVNGATTIIVVDASGLA